MNGALVDVRPTGDQVHIALSGDIDLANADEVEARVTSAITNQLTAVELDLADVTYLDSAGLQIVYTLAIELQRLQIGFTISAPVRSPARRALEVSGMTAIAPMEPPALQ
jgi:anti-anti-sigma factor